MSKLKRKKLITKLEKINSFTTLSRVATHAEGFLNFDNVTIDKFFFSYSPSEMLTEAFIKKN